MLPLAQPSVPWTPPILTGAPLGDWDRRPPTTDGALPVGIVDVSLGATTALFGVLLEDAEAKGFFFGAAVGSIAVGIPMIAAGSKKVEYARTSEALYTLGSVFVSMGGTVTGSAVGMIVGDQLERARRERELGIVMGEPHYLGAGIAMAVGSSFALVGSGLMVLGATEKSEEEQLKDAVARRERRAEAARAATMGRDLTVPRSVPRRTAGQVLVAIGGASGIGATIAGVTFADCGGDLCGFGHLFTTIPLAVNGVLCTAIGVPLWVSGASHVRVDELAEAETWIPEVSVGAGTASVTMRF